MSLENSNKEIWTYFIHTMTIGKWPREAKLALHPGCAEIVATTVHSFKGWESSHIVRARREN